MMLDIFGYYFTHNGACLSNYTQQTLSIHHWCTSFPLETLCHHGIKQHHACLWGGGFLETKTHGPFKHKTYDVNNNSSNLSLRKS